MDENLISLNLGPLQKSGELKVVILNNDFRVYWKGRLVYLRQFLADQAISFNAIELFGRGSPYAFDAYDNKEAWWTCLFPANSAGELTSKEIRKALFAALDHLDPNIVIAPSIVFYAGALGIRWAKKRDRKFIMFDDATPAQFRRNPVVQWVKDTIIRQSDGLWFPSPRYYAAFPLLRRAGIHFFSGFSCINNRHFKPAEKNGLNHHLLLCVARLVPIKNLDNLLKAWQQVERQSTGYRLVIIGDGPEREALKKSESGFGLTTVDFAGAADNRELPGYYAGADAFILPSLLECWGLVVNEAAAAGLPLLLSHTINAGGDLLEEGVNGFAFDPLDTGSIAEAILTYIALTPGAKRRMSENSLRIVDAMSYEQMGMQLTEALHSIAGSSRHPAGILAATVRNLWPGRYDTTAWFEAEV